MMLILLALSFFVNNPLNFLHRSDCKNDHKLNTNSIKHSFGIVNALCTYGSYGSGSVYDI